MNWQHKIRLKHLLTKSEKWENLQESMNKIADVLDNEPRFIRFGTKCFRQVPKDDELEVLTPLDYCNKLINMLYDYADDNAIWVE